MGTALLRHDCTSRNHDCTSRNLMVAVTPTRAELLRRRSQIAFAQQRRDLIWDKRTGHCSVRRGAGAAYARRMAAERGTVGPSDGPPGGPGPADDDPGPGLPPRPSVAARGRG